MGREYTVEQGPGRGNSRGGAGHGGMGGAGHGGMGGAGSGGGMLLTARRFTGAASGQLQANGGTISNKGGGGRIAVWTPFMSYTTANLLAQQETIPNAAEEIDPAIWPGWHGTTGVTGYEAGTVFFGRLTYGTVFMMR